MESPGAYVGDLVSRRNFRLVPVFFRTALPRSGDLSPGGDGMPLHDAVGVNCSNGASSENQGTGAYCIWSKICIHVG